MRALIRGKRLALAVSVAAAAACCSTPDLGGTPSPQADGGHDEAASDALDVLEAEAAEDVADVEYVDAEAPDGWHRWPYTPGNCPIFVPDDLASIEPLQWEPCPFQLEGCTRAVATWMAQTGGFGFGTGLQAMKTHDGVAFKYVRILPDYWSEVVVLIDETPVAAWRDQGGQGTCGGSPTLQWGNRASFPIIRYNAVTSPWVLLSDSVKDLMAPSRTEKFGPPDATIASTSGRAFWSDDLLVVWEETSSFAVRDLHTGATLRPRPAGIASQAHAIPFGDQVLWWTRDKGHGSIWLYSHGVDNVPLLRDDAISYDSIVTDGEVIVWTQSTGALGQDEYEDIEIWTSPIGAPVQLEPRMVVDGLSGIVPLLSVGEGWVALNRDGTMRLYRLSDGQRRSLPVVDKLVWSNGQFAIQVADGAVWVITRQLPSNTVPYITRFEIESLPTP